MWQHTRLAAAAPAPSASPSTVQPTGQSPSPSQSGEGGSAFAGIFMLLIVVFGLRGAAKRRTRKRRYNGLMAKYGDPSIDDRIMAAKMWQDMSAEMLTDSWGHPVDRDRDVYKMRTTEVWKYGQTGRNRFKGRVIVENSIVVGFKLK